MSNQQLSICIPTYNRFKNLEETLQDISSASKNISFLKEILILDNNENSKAKDIIEKHIPDNSKIKYVQNKNLETHILKKNKHLVGFYEQEYHPSSNEVELINMGVLKEFRGLKLGSTLLNHAIASASRKNPTRMWVHTCSLDHKHALQNYKSKGFEIFKEEEIDFVA